jgi:hypothetical protein
MDLIPVHGYVLDMAPDKRLSDSTIQKKAEKEIVEAAALALGVPLVRDREVTKISVGENAHVEVDAISPDGAVVVEAYARQGTLKGAQLKKIAQDVLKLSLLERSGAHVDRRVIVFASAEAEQSVRGWVRLAAEHFGVEFLVVKISQDLRDLILSAQGRQVMVNVDQVADDLVVPVDADDT